MKMVNSYFAKFDDSHCKQGIEAIECRWEEYIDLNRDYVEK